MLESKVEGNGVIILPIRTKGKRRREIVIVVDPSVKGHGQRVLVCTGKLLHKEI